MHKTGYKKSKIDKCPSTTFSPQENLVKDNVMNKCNSNKALPKNSEHMNGLVNGVSSENDVTVKKSNRKSKNKTKQQSNNENCELLPTAQLPDELGRKKDDSYIVQKNANEAVVDDQNSKSNKFVGTTTVNIVDKTKEASRKRKTKLEQLDSNDNISNKPDTSCDIDSEDLVKSNISSLSVKTHVDGRKCEQLDKCEPLVTAPKCTEDVTKLCPSTTHTSPAPPRDSDILTDITDSLGKIHLESSSQCSEQTKQQPKDDIQFIQYESELQMPMIMKIIQKDLSEPYSIYTYRYFIHNWPKLCFLVR